MDKVKKFLEGYVQWLAMALGLGFLGWMVYSYVLQKPVSVAVGDNPAASPGEVDKLVWEGPGQKLQSALQGKEPPQVVMPSPEIATLGIKKLDAVAPSVALVLPTPYTPIPAPMDQGPGDNSSKITLSKKIKSLPEAPALIDPKVSGGHSNVPAPQPAVAGGGAPPANTNLVSAVDKSWRTVEGTLHVADLAKSFADVGIAPGSTFSSTAFLKVELIREERNVDGSWGDETIVPPLDINVLQPMPAGGINAAFEDQKDYITNFAEKNVSLIVQPPFYQVLQGDVWYEPGTKNPNEVAASTEEPFDPANPLLYTGDPTRLLPDEQKIFNDAKARAAAKEAAKQKQGNRNSNPGVPPSMPGNPGGLPGGNPGGGTGRTGGGRGAPMAADPRRGQGDDRNMLMPPRLPNEPGMMPPPGYGAPGGMPPNGGGQAPGSSTLPTGSFDPSAVAADIKVWAHDGTVQAGKTYRYKLRYYLSNPVARTNNLCQDPADAKKFYIVSKDSAWTDAVSVESDTNFYAVDDKRGVHFDVFKWKDGIWKLQSVQVNPGDMIGSVATDAAGIKTDFTTGWTLVDVRADSGNNDNKVLVLVSDNGTILTKSLSSDRHDPAYRKLWEQSQLNKDKTASAEPNLPNPAR